MLVDSNHFLWWWQVGKLLASVWEVLFFLGLQTYPHALGETVHTIRWAGRAVIQDWDVQGGKLPKTPTAQRLQLNYAFNLTTPAPCIFLLCKQYWGYNKWISSCFLLPFDKASVLVFIFKQMEAKENRIRIIILGDWVQLSFPYHAVHWERCIRTMSSVNWSLAIHSDKWASSFKMCGLGIFTWKQLT